MTSIKAGQGRTIHSDPFHNVDILWEDDDRLKVAFDEGCFDKGAAEIERLGGCWACRGRRDGWGRHIGECGRCGCRGPLWSARVARHGTTVDAAVSSDET